MYRPLSGRPRLIQVNTVEQHPDFDLSLHGPGLHPTLAAFGEDAHGEVGRIPYLFAQRDELRCANTSNNIRRHTTRPTYILSHRQDLN